MNFQATQAIIVSMARLILLLFILMVSPFAALGKGGHSDIALLQLSLERPSTRKAQQTGVLHAPVFDRTVPALAFFKLQNNWRDDARTQYVTFGQSFTPGALKPDEAIAAQFGDAFQPAQLDVKSLHDDGSVRHGVVTIETPPLKSGKTIQGALVKTNTQRNETFDAAALLSQQLRAPISLKFYYADGSTKDFSADIAKLALAALNENDQARWIDGPLATEFRFEKAAAQHLNLRFDVRVYRNGVIRLSAAFINEKSFAPGRRDSVYDVAIGDAFSAQKVPHHRAANWRRIFWTQAEPRLHIMHDLETLIASGALAPLDVSLGVNATVIAKRDALLRELPPLSPALIERYMPMTGGRPDIGLYPQWVSHYLAAQSEAAKRVMLANAEAAGAVPWHYANEWKGAPISIEEHPKFWADERGLERQYSPDRPHRDIFASSNGGWTPDHSHKPALAAIPWLVTGDQYYADELAMQAAWAVFGRWPALREGGVKAVDVEQVRASAWSLRDISDAAYLLPDNNSSKEYLKRVLRENLRIVAKKYVDDRKFLAADELEGYFEELIEREPERISPWQNDYMALSLGLAAQRGNTDAQRLLAWSANFHAQRFLHAAFDFRLGSSYQLPAKDADTQAPVSNWAALAEKMRTSASVSPDLMEGYPELANGYVGSALAALTTIASQTSSPAAFEALATLLRETKNYAMWTPTNSGGAFYNNNFLFMLTAPNGATYDRKTLRWKKAAADHPSLIIGDYSRNKLAGGGRGDALFGLGGDDEIAGGDGPDYISGGKGNDTLSGGGGADIFAFAHKETGADIITDFDTNTDRIHISADIFDSKTKLLNAVAATPDGAQIAFSGARNSVVLKGVGESALSAKNFIIIH